MLMGSFVGVRKDAMMSRWLGMAIIGSTVPYWGTPMYVVIARVHARSRVIAAPRCLLAFVTTAASTPSSTPRSRSRCVRL